MYLLHQFLIVFTFSVLYGSQTTYAHSRQINNAAPATVGRNTYNAPVYCPPRYPSWFKFDIYPPGSNQRSKPNRPSNYNSNLPVVYDGPRYAQASTSAGSHSGGGNVFNAPIHGGVGDTGGANGQSVAIAGRFRRRRDTFNAPVACS